MTKPSDDVEVFFDAIAMSPATERVLALIIEFVVTLGVAFTAGAKVMDELRIYRENNRTNTTHLRSVE